MRAKVPTQRKESAVMKTPLFGAFGGTFPPESDGSDDHHPHRLGSIQKIEAPMRRFTPGEEVDIVIVGVGSAGGVLLQRLARAGFRVVGFDAGPVLE
jgi:NADPH-dependent 2,4-dienoyl-CoA reductase/sulfur reductase-like enzyme